jgi:hypothetical protein
MTPVKPSTGDTRHRSCQPKSPTLCKIPLITWVLQTPTRVSSCFGTVSEDFCIRQRSRAFARLPRLRHVGLNELTARGFRSIVCLKSVTKGFSLLDEPRRNEGAMTPMTKEHRSGERSSHSRAPLHSIDGENRSTGRRKPSSCQRIYLLLISFLNHFKLLCNYTYEPNSISATVPDYSNVFETSRRNSSNGH